MRRLLAIASALLLIAAVAMHLAGNNGAAELAGDLAFFTLLIAVALPEPRTQRPHG